MQATNRFFGDLLLGGVRLQRLECELHEVPNNEEELWTGRFHIPKNMVDLFEMNRTYLLELEDGRKGRVVVCAMHESDRSDSNSGAPSIASSMMIEFHPAPK